MASSSALALLLTEADNQDFSSGGAGNPNPASSSAAGGDNSAMGLLTPKVDSAKAADSSEIGNIGIDVYEPVDGEDDGGMNGAPQQCDACDEQVGSLDPAKTNGSVLQIYHGRCYWCFILQLLFFRALAWKARSRSESYTWAVGL